MRGKMTIKPGRWAERMKHRHAHAQRGRVNRDDVNRNEVEEGGRYNRHRTSSKWEGIYEYDVERCKAESKKDDMTTDRW